jgi:hypothetical protein
MSTDDSVAMFHGEYAPRAAELRAVGALGILLFLTIGTGAVHGGAKAFMRRSYLNVAFYVCILLLAVFELPRYCAIAAAGAYTSVPCYAMHILSGICYFAALALVGYSFANLLELGQYVSLLYSKRGLLAAVAVHATVDFAAFVECLRSRSLAVFFTSTAYAFFIAWDIAQNLLYSSLLLYFGVRLVARFGNLEKASSDGAQRAAFHAVVTKVSGAMALISVFAALRLVLLAVKGASLQNAATDRTFTTPTFSLYGVVWFLLSDFLPRGGSSAAMLYLMRSGGGSGGGGGQTRGEEAGGESPRRGDADAEPGRGMRWLSAGIGKMAGASGTASDAGTSGMSAASSRPRGVMGDAFDDCFDVSVGAPKKPVAAAAAALAAARARRGEEEDGVRGGYDEEEEEDDRGPVGSSASGARNPLTSFHAPRSS